MKSAQGRNSETPDSTSFSSFSSAAGVTDPSTEFLDPLGVPRSFHLLCSAPSSVAGGSTMGMRGGMDGRLAAAAVVSRTLVSIPGGTGRLTLLTVGTNLRTLVVAEVAGTVATEIDSVLGVATGAAELVVVVVSDSDGVSALFCVVPVPPGEDFGTS